MSNRRQGGSLKLTVFCGCLAVISMLLISPHALAMQEKPSDDPSQEQAAPATAQSPMDAELAKYPGLLPELVNLRARVMKAIELPPPRTRSRLLPMMPDSTVLFAALPNYGNAAHQALQAFQQELKESEVLRNWWQHSAMNSSKPGLEDELEKFYQFSQYIGDEIALSADMREKKESLVFIAEIRKPGLKLFLEQLGQQLAGKSGLPWRIYDPQQLALAKAAGNSSALQVLVRQDLLIISPDLAALRSFNATLSQGGGRFPASPFGQRLAQSYHSGTEILAGIDVHGLIGQVAPGGSKEQETLRRSGFDDLKYLIWERRNSPGQPASQAELSFDGKRHGVASWLAVPTKLGGLDFVSPDATIALAMALKGPAQIYDDLAGIAGTDAMAPLAQGAASLDINLRDDLLRQLTGEITLEVNGPILPVPGAAPSDPVWTLILGVTDAEGLQKTFERLSAALNSMGPQGQGPSLQRHEAGRLPHYTLRIPSPQKAMEITLAFSDGYLLVAPRRDLVTEGVRFHHDGGSLARSAGFHAALPPGFSADASALYYQNIGSVMATMMQNLSPELARLVSDSGEKAPPAISTVYADETMIRQVSSSGSLDVGVMAAVAAIAIPNLMRARISANEAAAAQTLRTVVTNEIAYDASYPRRGYAPDLATLGGSSADCPGGVGSEKHACLIDEVLGSPACTGGTWCQRDSYRYHLMAKCPPGKCVDFVIVATPQDSNQGMKSFCATSDGVVRYQTGAPLTSPIATVQCLKWEPL